MEKLLIVAALACQPGDRSIDLSSKLPRGLQYMDFIVSGGTLLRAALHLSAWTYPDSFQQCCDATNLPPFCERANRGRSFLCSAKSVADEMALARRCKA